MIDLAPVRREDAELLAMLQHDAFLPIWEIYHDERNPCLRGAEDIADRLDNPRNSYFRIISDGETVGGIWFYRISDEGKYYLNRLYVAPERQRQGIASAALKLGIGRLKNAGRIEVDFPTGLEKNRRFYESCGFADTGRRIESAGMKLSIYEKIIG